MVTRRHLWILFIKRNNRSHIWTSIHAKQANKFSMRFFHHGCLPPNAIPECPKNHSFPPGKCRFCDGTFVHFHAYLFSRCKSWYINNERLMLDDYGTPAASLYEIILGCIMRFARRGWDHKRVRHWGNSSLRNPYKLSKDLMDRRSQMQKTRSYTYVHP